MIAKLRTMLLVGSLGTALWAGGASDARAQFVAVTPGFGLSVGNTYGAFGGYPGGVYPGYGYGGGGYGYGYGRPFYGPRPWGGYYNRGYGYGYGPRPGFGYGPRPGYHHGPYRRW